MSEPTREESRCLAELWVPGEVWGAGGRGGCGWVGWVGGADGRLEKL